MLNVVQFCMLYKQPHHWPGSPGVFTRSTKSRGSLTAHPRRASTTHSRPNRDHPQRGQPTHNSPTMYQALAALKALAVAAASAFSLASLLMRAFSLA